MVGVVVGHHPALDDTAAAHLEAPAHVPGHYVADVLVADTGHIECVSGGGKRIEWGGVVALGAVGAGEGRGVVAVPGVADGVKLNGVGELHLGVVPGEEVHELIAV